MKLDEINGKMTTALFIFLPSMFVTYVFLLSFYDIFLIRDIYLPCSLGGLPSPSAFFCSSLAFL